ncbi:MAG: hypothetical protein HGA44_11520 [Cellulomonadaceae bacterium]|nr:hypothetical protein [Cellulomonadaceae bacterium]
MTFDGPSGGHDAVMRTRTAGALTLLPLGTLAPRPGESWSGEELDLALVMPEGVRLQVVDYLSRCPVYLAWMEYTRDVIGDRFGVSGGSAIASDGTFYWRLDGVEYIREYGIAVPEAAIRHMESHSWIPPEVGQDRYFEIYDELMKMIG